MSDAPATDTKAARPKGGLARLLFIPLAFAAGAGAGGVGAVIAAGKLGLGGAGEHDAAPKASVAAPVEYIEIDTAFTSNLVDTGRYLQVRLSVSTTGGPDVVAAIARHKPALVSTILSVLGELSENDVADRAGKDKLRARLKVAVNEMLGQKGVANGVDEVFFISLVVQ
ncbi:MAG: hypothetical protein DCF31_15130 [Alphaproteobacteria bacterium]|nr:MAG: hypothetical protein DCF31_15130 [Alphaproteobacteria bacterium]